MIGVKMACNPYCFQKSRIFTMQHVLLADLLRRVRQRSEASKPKVDEHILSQV
jgi:hypothetical protein